MSEMKVVVIKLGIDFDLQAEIEARAKKPVELTNSGADELDKAVSAKMASKKREKKLAAESRAKAKADAAAEEAKRVDGAVKALIVNSAQSKATSASDLLAAAGGLSDGEFKNLMTKIKHDLKERGLEVQKSTRKGVVYFTAVKF
jgi:hypothetical protein